MGIKKIEIKTHVLEYSILDIKNNIQSIKTIKDLNIVNFSYFSKAVEKGHLFDALSFLFGNENEFWLKVSANTMIILCDDIQQYIRSNRG